MPSSTHHASMGLATIRTSVGYMSLMMTVTLLTLTLPAGVALDRDGINVEHGTKRPKVIDQEQYVCIFNSSIKRNTAVAELDAMFDASDKFEGPRPGMRSFSTIPAAVMTFPTEKHAEEWMKGRSDLNYCEKDHMIQLTPTPEFAERLTPPFDRFGNGSKDKTTAAMELPSNNVETTPYGINLINALKVSDYDASAERKVCIVDTGYDLGHVDLPSNRSIVTGVDERLCNDIPCNWFDDPHGHGTHVAGTIAAIGDNHIGVRGVIGNAKLKIHIARVLDSQGSGPMSSVIKAIEKCAEDGAHVINMSLGSVYFSKAARDAIRSILSKNENLLIVAAAGNDGNSWFSYPASHDGVVSVASVDESSDRSYFSQYNKMVDIAAPGSSIWSTAPQGGYSQNSGTSMAAAHVSAVAALIWSHFPEKNANDILKALERSAKDLGPPGKDNYYGHGLIDAVAAYNHLSNALPSPSTAPISSQEPSSAVVPSPSLPSSSCGDDEVLFEVSFHLDFFPAETVWALVDENSSSLLSGGGYSSQFQKIYDSVCLPVMCEDSPVFTFFIEDKFGDGIGAGAMEPIEIFLGGKPIHSKRDFRDGNKYVVAFNPCPGTTSCAKNEALLELDFQLGNLPMENNLLLTNTIGETNAFEEKLLLHLGQGSGGWGDKYAHFHYKMCLPVVCDETTPYQITMNDSFGDGINVGTPVTVSFDGNLIHRVHFDSGEQLVLGDIQTDKERCTTKCMKGKVCKGKPKKNGGKKKNQGKKKNGGKKKNQGKKKIQG